MARRRVLLDVGPLRRSRDLRLLVAGQFVSIIGTQLTAVAVPFEVYRITHSSLQVGLVSLVQLVPLLIGSLVGGSVVDAVDRRRLLLVVETLMACSSAGLALDADLGLALWPLYVLPALTAGLSGFDSPARGAIVPNLVARSEFPAANAMVQAMFQVGSIVGPAVGGLLLAGAGVKVVFWLDAASFLVCVSAVSFMGPQRPHGGGQRAGIRSIADGMRFVRGRQAIQGAYLIDVDAMVFGMPRALFPALGTTVFGGGASTVGLLYAAPGVGAAIGAVTTGWAGSVRRQGRAVIVAVVAWGAAIAAFGVVRWLPAALVLLAVAGWADVISAVFRNTIIQLATPDNLRGRLAALQIAVVTGGPRLGDAEAGAVATGFGAEASVVSGGVLCIVGALALARALPGFRTQVAAPHDDAPPSTSEEAVSGAVEELEPGAGGPG
ncbi:MAG TPA: MFS transporter [Acidimicrobiales bacterium]|nr:MFS transporter [Acidimicrobiales bacterium]